MDESLDNGSPRAEAETDCIVRVSYRSLLLAAALVGVMGGLAAAGYAAVLHALLVGVWDILRPSLAAFIDGVNLPGTAISLLILTTVGGLLVGLSLKVLGVPGEIAAVVNNIHLQDGRIDVRQTPSMLLASLISIVAGGSAGPEAPLVQMIGSGGSWLGDRLRWISVHVRTLTFCGMAAALGAFFGAPLAGAVFALEIPHRNGLEYYEALLPSLIAAFLSFWIFDAIGGHPHPLFPLQFEVHASMSFLIGQSVLLGAAGAGVAVVFTHLFRWLGNLLQRWESHHLTLGTLGGLILGLLALASPGSLPTDTLFWGEFQMRALLEAASGGEWSHQIIGALIVLALLKMLAVGITLRCGFRGGFIFPLFFIGGTLGIAVSLGTAGWFQLPVAVLCLMAAVNVAVTRTPVSTTVLLGTLSGTASIPLILAASLTSFLLSARIRMINTQRSRTLPGSLTWRETETNPGRQEQS